MPIAGSVHTQVDMSHEKDGQWQRKGSLPATATSGWRTRGVAQLREPMARHDGATSVQGIQDSRICERRYGDREVSRPIRRNEGWQQRICPSSGWIRPWAHRYRPRAVIKLTMTVTSTSSWSGQGCTCSPQAPIVVRYRMEVPLPQRRRCSAQSVVDTSACCGTGYGRSIAFPWLLQCYNRTSLLCWVKWVQCLHPSAPIVTTTCLASHGSAPP